MQTKTIIRCAALLMCLAAIHHRAASQFFGVRVNALAALTGTVAVGAEMRGNLGMERGDGMGIVLYHLLVPGERVELLDACLHVVPGDPLTGRDRVQVDPVEDRAVVGQDGVRIGTAEIYRQVEPFDEIIEAVVIGQDWPPEHPTDVRVVLFVKLRESVELTETLIENIKRTIRNNATPRHVPAKIIAVPDIPRTRNGKITELAVRQVVHGQPVQNREALANPDALNHFQDRIDLRS